MTTRTTAVRGLLREHGVTLSLGARPVLTQLPRLLEDAELPLPVHLRTALGLVDAELRERETRIQTVEQQLTTFAAHDAGTQRLLRGAGGRALDRHRARGERRAHPRVPAGPAVCELAGLTPREHSSGTRRRRGAITKQGHRYLRYLLTHGARSVVLAGHRRQRTGTACTPLHPWAVTIAHRRGFNKATIAGANKLARIIWAVWHRDVPFHAGAAAAPAA